MAPMPSSFLAAALASGLPKSYSDGSGAAAAGPAGGSLRLTNGASTSAGRGRGIRSIGPSSTESTVRSQCLAPASSNLAIKTTYNTQNSVASFKARSYSNLSHSMAADAAEYLGNHSTGCW